MAWYLNRALTNFRNEVNERWPDRDKKSDGTIGDAAHQATSSDHNPDPDGSVDAWDMDNNGVDIAACKRAFEAHPASKYWIYNDTISFRSEGWKPRSYAYAGPNRSRHTEHVHWNTREGYETSNQPWFTEEDMAVTQDDLTKIAEAVNNFKYGVGGKTLYSFARDAAAAATNSMNGVAQLLVSGGAGDNDVQQIVAGVLAGLSPEAIAAAIPQDLASQVADELSKRLNNG